MSDTLVFLTGLLVGFVAGFSLPILVIFVFGRRIVANIIADLRSVDQRCAEAKAFIEAKRVRPVPEYDWNN